MLRIAWFSPLYSSARSRSAVFTEAVLRDTPSQWDVELFVNDRDWRTAEKEASEQLSFCGYPLHHFHRCFHRHSDCPFDIFVYHLEDSPDCRFVQQSLGLWSGVCFLHDLNLNRLYLDRFRHCTTGAEINEEMDRLFGEDSVRLGDWFEREWPIDIFDKSYVRGRAEMEKAGVLVVSSDNHLERLKASYPEKAIETTPFPQRMVPLKNVSEIGRRLRMGLGLEREDVVVGYAGQFLLEDRAKVALEAFSGLKKALVEREDRRMLRFLWIVEEETLFDKAQELVQSILGNNEELKSSVAVVLVDSPEAFGSMLCVADAFVGVSFDLLRGMPLGVLLAMARGVPVVVSDIGPGAAIPTGAALQVSLGRGERLALEKTLKELVDNPKLRQSLGEAARDYVRSICSPYSVVDRLDELFAKHRENLSEKLARSQSCHEDARLGLVRDLRSWFEDRSFPVSSPGQEKTNAYDLIAKKAVKDFGWE